MWYVEVFESFKNCINLFKNLFSIYFAKFASLFFCEKVDWKKLIWKFHSYDAFWKDLGHDLMNQAHAMHFSIISKKHVLNVKFEFMENLLLKSFTLS